MCLAQRHSTVMPVRLEPAALWSRIKHSTTEPLRSHKYFGYLLYDILFLLELWVLVYKRLGHASQIPLSKQTVQVNRQHHQVNQSTERLG